MRKLPISIQTFEEIRKDGYLYVDKTAWVYQIANVGKPYFLIRPRRFGKSLLLSTFEAYFSGRKDLFQGLAIEKLEIRWEAYPIFHLDLNARKYETGFHIAKFMRDLRAGDVDAFMEGLKVFFAGIPYELNDNTERHYQAVFYVIFTLLGQFIETEVRSARGCADAVVKTKDTVFVFEFKLNGSAEEALRQILLCWMGNAW